MTVEDIDSAQEQENTPQEPEKEPEGHNEEQEQTQETPEADSVDALPEWAQTQIRSLRSENARRRTELNDLKGKLDKAKSPEDFEAAVQEYQDKVEKLERDLAFAQHTADLDEDLRALVTGNTEDEIKASADRVRAAFAARNGAATPSDVRGGITPSLDEDDDGDTDPIALARKIRAANHFRR